jgi:hypothetical protein
MSQYRERSGSMAMRFEHEFTVPVPEERQPATVPATREEPGLIGTLRSSRTPDEEALDLLEVAGAPLIKRIAPIAGAVAALALVAWLIRRFTRRSLS